MAQPSIDEITIYEDDDFIALNKPAGMLAIPDRFNKELINLYDSLTDKYGKIFIVHRLDKDTSGVIVFAKNAEAHRGLSIKWEKGEVNKSYYALLIGHVEKKQGTISLPIAPLKKKKGVMVVGRRNGKKSVTFYKVIKDFKDYSLVEAAPKTGRTHKIRVHFAFIGHPIAGDILYNRKEAIGKLGLKSQKIDSPAQSKIEISRLALHAIELRFVHYKKKETIKIRAEIPGDFKSILSAIASHDFDESKNI